MIDINMFERFNGRIMSVTVNHSTINECSITTKIYYPKFELIDDMLVISNYGNDRDVNEIQINIDGFEFNKYNSSKNKLIFNSKLNYINSLSLQMVTLEDCCK